MSRIQLVKGNSINDVYLAFCEVAYGSEQPLRGRAELKAALPGRYEDAGKYSVALAWAHGESDDADVRLEDEIEVSA